MKKVIASVIAIAALGTLVFAAIGMASKPPAPPGQDPCSHGRTGKPCRPDPQPDNGKDCEKHGKKGGINEDHCKGQETTTTGTTETTTTGTTDTTTTTTTVQTTTTNQTTTNSVPTTPTGTTPTETQPTTPTPTTPGEVSNPPTKEPQTQPKSHKPPVTPGKRSVSPPKGNGELPFTGLPLWVFIILGAAMSGGGLLLRRVV